METEDLTPDAVVEQIMTKLSTKDIFKVALATVGVIAAYEVTTAVGGKVVRSFRQKRREKKIQVVKDAQSEKSDKK